MQPVADGHRIVRLRLDASGTRVNRLEVIDEAMTLPDPSGITMLEGFICYIATVRGAPVMRRVKVGK